MEKPLTIGGMLHDVYLALGTNLGDRQDNLAKALAGMPPAVHVVRASSVLETEPWGYLEQPRFLNQVVQAETELEPEELLTFVKQLEVKVGRTPTFHYGPRQIDIDILLYDDLQLDTPSLTIPHPQIPFRDFVLLPLRELAPKLAIPGLGKTVEGLVSEGKFM
jgi:2-amino-4-hydroxy-6-hydroxymethyldihydropteridine diphosphokinase